MTAIFSRWEDSADGSKLPVDRTSDGARPDEFDPVLLPGGAINPDKLRMDPKAVRFVKAFLQPNKPVAAICHGPWQQMGGKSLRGPPSGPICEMPERSGRIKRLWWMAICFRAKSRTTFLHSTAKCKLFSQEAKSSPRAAATRA
jgi:DJ-1/PfpI family protein